MKAEKSVTYVLTLSQKEKDLLNVVASRHSSIKDVFQMLNAGDITQTDIDLFLKSLHEFLEGLG